MSENCFICHWTLWSYDEDPAIAIKSQAETICRTRVSYLDSSSTRTGVGQGWYLANLSCRTIPVRVELEHVNLEFISSWLQMFLEQNKRLQFCFIIRVTLIIAARSAIISSCLQFPLSRIADHGDRLLHLSTVFNDLMVLEMRFFKPEFESKLTGWCVLRCLTSLKNSWDCGPI